MFIHLVFVFVFVFVFELILSKSTSSNLIQLFPWPIAICRFDQKMWSEILMTAMRTKN